MKRATTDEQAARGNDGRAAREDVGPDAREEPPPFGGSWRALYAVVLVNLAVLVALFHLFTGAFR